MFVVVLGLQVEAQNIIYHRIKDFAAQAGDTLTSFQFLNVEKRSKSQLMLQSGGDYKITSNSESTNRALKRRTLVVQIDSTLYVNCRKLRLKRFRFGRFYAPAMVINNNIYFCAAPIGPAAVAVVNRDIGMGAFGEAVASSSAISQRVYYELNSETGKVEFIGKEKMLELLAGNPELKEAFLKESNEEAHITGKYLRELKCSE